MIHKKIVYFTSLAIMIVVGLSIINSCNKKSNSSASTAIVVDDPNSFIYKNNAIGDTIIGYTGARGYHVKVVLPASHENRPIIAIADGVFQNIGQVDIPTTVTNLGTTASNVEGVFSFCSFKMVTLPNSLRVIGTNAFLGSGLTAITIPASVTTIAPFAFSSSNLETITIPNTVTNLGTNVFASCVSLTDAILPNNLVQIPASLFSDCKRLHTIILPDVLKTIGASAFLNCDSLKNIIFPDVLTTIGASAFLNCNSLKNIILPIGLTSIGNSAFEGCTNLKAMRIAATTPPTLGKDGLKNTHKELQISVPMANVNAYKNAEGWSTFAKQIIGY